MKRALLAAALVLVVAGCDSDYDRYLPEFAARRLVAAPNGPVVFTVARSGEIVYAELRTLNLYKVEVGQDPVLLTRLAIKPDSLSVNESGRVYAAGRDHRHRMRIWHAADLDEPEKRAKNVIEKLVPGVNGPASRFPVHFVVTGTNTFIVGYSRNLFEIRGGQPYEKRTLISNGWTDPVFTRGRGSRIWVADNALPGGKERLARGRDKSVSHRNRFASVMPEYTNPSDMVLIDDELLLCSRTHKKVYRLHIGVDDVARWRGVVDGLVCDRNIGVASDGSLITAQTSAIYRYPPR